MRRQFKTLRRDCFDSNHDCQPLRFDRVEEPDWMATAPRFGRRRRASAPAHKWPLRLSSRRTSVPQRRAPYGLGLCRLSASHSLSRAHWPRALWRFPCGPAPLLCCRPGGSNHRHRAHGKRAWRRTPRAIHLRASCGALACASVQWNGVPVHVLRFPLVGSCRLLHNPPAAH